MLRRGSACCEVAMNTLGAHAEFALKEYLVRSGLSAKQITLLMLTPVNGERALRNHQVDLASLSVIAT
jgi:ABC-type nitrate/sulfonate/bicarbonate transport system substrate-binding protein